MLPPLLLAVVAPITHVFLELGAVVLGLALLTRLASRWGFSAIPLYLLAGLAFGNGGLVPLNFSEEFVHVGGEIGVLLLLFLLGLEYTGEELQHNLNTGLPAGVIDLGLNLVPGVLAGWLLGWKLLPALLLGGVTYISSSGVIAKVLSELKRRDNPETPSIMSVLVLEDLAMAVYLPLMTVLLIGQGVGAAVVSVGLALATVGGVLFVALRFSRQLSQFVEHESDEVLLFSALGLMLLVAGLAQRLQVSAAVGAFLVGVALSGPVARRTYRLLRPLRDLFAATFFLFFGLEIDPATLLPQLGIAAALALVTTFTKLLTGWWAARRAGLDVPARLRAGGALVARGEFSIVIAALGTAAEPRLGPLAASYVLYLAIAGPLLARFIEPLGRLVGVGKRSD